MQPPTLTPKTKTEEAPHIPELAEVPSVITQAKTQGWDAGFFHFGKAEQKGVDYFNCGLVHRPDGLWLIVRRSKWKNGLRFGMNDLVAFLLNGRNPVRGVPIRTEKRWPDEQWEDPRAVFANGKTFVTCCNFIWANHGWTGAHQMISEVNSDWSSVKRYDPIYGHNGDNIGQNKHHEKNWLLWFHKGEPHIVYKGNPHVVARFTKDFELIEEWETEGNLQWNYGEIRGGTPPVLLDREYWTFAHSSTPWKGNKRQYHLLAYAFQCHPPFRITRIVNTPLLSGSPEDGGIPTKPPCLFACGSIIRNHVWTITAGVNDKRCAWFDIPHADILKRCRDVC